MLPSAHPVIDLGSLQGFGDPVVIRDPSGRSRRPALLRREGIRGSGLEVRGPFSIVQRYSVIPREGALFARTTRDENPIHTRGNVVPGAMTAARFILVPEMLLPGGRVERAKIRFRAIARYGRPTVNLFRADPAPDGSVRIAVRVRQDGADVADGIVVMARRGASCSVPREPAAEVEDPGTVRVTDFLAALRIDPSAFFGGAGRIYPRAFLAALPSGEMVRKYSGEGGILNSLDLEFAREDVPSARSVPSVELEDAARARKTFRKVLARIAEGVRTFCSGFAMVLPRESAGLLE